MDWSAASRLALGGSQVTLARDRRLWRPPLPVPAVGRISSILPTYKLLLRTSSSKQRIRNFYIRRHDKKVEPTSMQKKYVSIGSPVHNNFKL